MCLLLPRSELRKKPSSLPRCHYNAKRKGRSNRKAKRSYETEDEAILIVNRLKDEGLIAYRCPFCNKWHVGHPSEENNIA
jgi:hypothetical protein